MVTRSEQTGRERAAHGLQTAWGIHAGLLLLAGTACFSAQRQLPPPFELELILRGLLGLALILSALLVGHGGGMRAGFRAVVALGAGVLLGLTSQPRLMAYTPETATHPLVYLQVDLGSVAVVAVFLFWIAYHGAGGERWGPPVPLRRSLLLAAVLLSVIAIAIFVPLRQLYGPEAELRQGRVFFQAVEMTLLLVAVLGSTGGPLVRRWPAFYLGAALIAAAVLGWLALRGGGGW